LVRLESWKERIVVGVVRAVSAFLVVAALGLTSVAAPGLPECASCCPARETNGAAFSSLACCDEGCAERLATGQERPCVTSSASPAAKSSILPVTIAPLADASPAGFEFLTQQALWRTVGARDGTLPLRL
jgi:hypothetical protein